MIDATVAHALNEQVRMEAQSSHAYLAMAVWADTSGFDGTAQFLYAHAEEERMHMLKLVQFINERGGKAVVPAISEPNHSYSGLQEVFETVLDHETKVTSNIHAVMIAESDSLFLTNAQIAALRRSDSAYSAEVRAIYLPLGRFLAQFEGGVAGKAALDSVKAAEKAYWKVFWRQPEIADSAITPLQRELLPMLKSMLSIPQKDRENSRWIFGNPVKFVPEAPRAQAAVQEP